MNFVILGGDGRFVRLCRFLGEEGHGVFPMALEKALPLEGPPDYGGTEAVILPLPVEKGGLLNAPLSHGKYEVLPLLEHFRLGTKIFAGMAGEKLVRFCAEKGFLLRDYFSREDFQIKNALLTAEGALGLLLGQDGKGLCRRRALISGFGRIGRLLAPRLQALGMELSVLARSASDRALAEAMGCRALRPGESLRGFDFALNTVPAEIFGEKELGELGDARLIELASAPGGFNRDAAEKLGKNIVPAPGLPGKWAEDSAAEAIRDTIYNILEE